MAAGWFQKATGVFGRRDAPPQPYEITCDCGAQLTGFRTDSPQKPTCPACGLTHFVLPACLLPIPASLRAEWFGEASPAPRTKKDAPPKGKKTPAKRSRTAAREEPTPKPAKAAEPRVPLSTRVREQITPARIIVLSLAAIITMTGLVLWRNAQREWARSNLQPAMDRGHAALQERDFPTAATAFEDAVRFLDQLGRDDAGAAAVRQYAQEATIATQLSTRSLTDLLQDATRGRKNADIGERFTDSAAGEWLLFDAVLEEITVDNETRWHLDLPLSLGERPLDLVFEELPWPAFQKTGDGPRRAIFAAQLDRLELPPGSAGGPRLVLRSPTAVLWCHFDSLQGVSMSEWSEVEEADVRAVLKSQKAVLGVGEGP